MHINVYTYQGAATAPISRTWWEYVRVRIYYLVNARANVFLCKLQNPISALVEMKFSTLQQRLAAAAASAVCNHTDNDDGKPLLSKPNFTNFESAHTHTHTHTKWTIFATNLYTIYVCYNIASVHTILSFNILLSIFDFMCAMRYAGVCVCVLLIKRHNNSCSNIDFIAFIIYIAHITHTTLHIVDSRVCTQIRCHTANIQHNIYVHVHVHVYVYIN